MSIIPLTYRKMGMYNGRINGICCKQYGGESMPRPRKCRKVCCLPDNDGFVPVRGGEELTPIVLNVDEYEAIRLIDREVFLRSNVENICVLPEQRFSRFMQLPVKNWRMHWLRDFLCESKEGILCSAAETAQPTGAEIAIRKNPSDAFETLHRVGLCPDRKRWTAQGSETR